MADGPLPRAAAFGLALAAMLAAVCGQKRTTATSSVTQSRPTRIISRRRSRGIRCQPVVGGQVNREPERLVAKAFNKRHIVDDDELGSDLQGIDELPEVVVVALEHHADGHLLQASSPIAGLDGCGSRLVSHPGL